MSAAMAARARAGFEAALAPIAVTRLLWLGVSTLVVLFDLHGTLRGQEIGATLVHWDAIAYLRIAEHGYPATLDYHDAYLPGFPLLVRGLMLLARDPIISAWLVNLASQAVALWFLYRLIAAERDRRSAIFSVWLVALLPTAVFFAAPFTESTFVAAAAAALYFSRQGRSRAAALAAAAALAVRLTGLALIPALLLEQLARGARRSPRSLLWLLVVPLPLVAFGMYLFVHTGDALGFVHANILPSFDHRIAAPWDGLGASWNTMTSTTDGETRSIFAREVAFGLLGLVACIAMFVSPRVPRSFAVYCAVAWLMTASLSFWRSEPRYLLTLFPAVIVVADATASSRSARAALLGACAVLMCLGVWIYADGRWLG